MKKEQKAKVQKAKVSVVIPTIHEEGVFGIIDKLREKLPDVEIIIVDKSDEEYEKRLMEKNVTVIRQHDRGVEKAIFLGLKHAHGDILASIDGDGTHDVEGIFKGIKIIEEGKADLVLGNRLGHIKEGAMNPYLQFGNMVISTTFNKLYNTNIHDFLVGLFVMSRKAYEEVKHVEPYRAGHAGVFAIELAKRGYKIAEVPINYYPRKEGTSKLTRSKFLYGVNVVGQMIRLARDYSPLLVFGGVGAIFVIAGLALGLYIIYNFLSTGEFTLIGRSLIAFMLFITGVLSIIAGFIIDLLIEIERRLERIEKEKK
ncbi:MAG: glycosyltransferase [Candidatus Micrarchaeales archaeon]